MTNVNSNAPENKSNRQITQIEFVQGNACELPFEDNSFDVVTAVECVFHFPSREQFFRKARRVLKPGGHLVQAELFLPILKFIDNFIADEVGSTYGEVNNNISLNEYRKLAKNHQFISQIEAVP